MNNKKEYRNLESENEDGDDNEREYYNIMKDVINHINQNTTLEEIYTTYVKYNFTANNIKKLKEFSYVPYTYKVFLFF